MPAVNLPLRDVHLPEAVGWWPPAFGWWLLAASIPLMIVLIYGAYRVLTRNTAIKTARKTLATIKQNRTQDTLARLRELSELIRRVAISMAPRSETASLTGPSWLAYLDRSIPGEPFTHGVGRYLSDAHYRREAPAGLDMDQLIALCEQWLKAQEKR
ncbi:MAG: DUF4381 domain-containing protein [Gammaproteobacteria bacterium]